MPLKTILLLGLSPSVVRALSQAAAAERSQAVEASFADEERLAELARAGSALAFVSANPALRRSILDHLAPPAPFVVVGERGGPAEWLDAVRLGARDYLEPPFGIEEIRSILRRAWRAAPMNRYVSFADAA